MPSTNRPVPLATTGIQRKAARIYAGNLTGPSQQTHKKQIISIILVYTGVKRLIVAKGLNTLCVLSAQSRTRSSDIALLRSLKQCSADREYTYWTTLAQYAKTQSRTNASDIAHFVRIV